MKKILQNLFKNKSKFKEEEYKSKILPKIRGFREILKSKKTISFLHYGHLGDIVNSLPVIKELSKDKKCILASHKKTVFYRKQITNIPINIIPINS